MSVTSRMRNADVFNLMDRYDDYGRPIQTYEPFLTTTMSISYKSQQNVQSSERYSDITHVGLTTCKALKKGQKVIVDGKKYIIHLQPLNSSRFTQVYLKEVKADGD